jgi:hypothetical protein
MDRPEIWSGLVHFRNDAVDHSQELVTYLLRVQHKKSWQDMPPIMVHKGELQRYATMVASDLGIVWRSPHHRIRVVEVPAIRQAQAEDDQASKKPYVEPFLRFMQAETGS